MSIELIAIGNEVLSGRTVNTNGAYLAEKLFAMGYLPTRQSVIGDDPKAIRDTLSEAMGRAKLVVATGGLGPTLDDLTREAAQSLFHAQPKILPNPIGTALGAYFEEEGRALLLLPGIPREMIRIFEESAFRIVERRMEGEPKAGSEEISLCLLKEAQLDPLLRELKSTHPKTGIGIYPSYGSIRIEAVGEGASEVCAAVRAAYPTYVFTKTIAESLHEALRRGKKTLSLAESCTGGAIASRLTALPHASHFLLGSVVAYSDSWKERLLGVSSKTLKAHGAVSRETVIEMATGLLERTHADYAAAVSGIAGPSGGTIEKPVGTVFIAIAKRGGKIDAGRIQGPRDRAGVIELSVQTTLAALLRREAYNEMTICNMN